MAAVRPLKRQTNRAHVAEVPDADDAIIASIVNEAGGATTGNLYGAADSTTTTVNLGTGSGVTAVNIGDASSIVTVNDELVVSGNLTVNGTTTTIDTANLNVQDKLININSGAATEPTDSMGISMERGSTGDDAVFIYNANTTDRFEFGFFETSGGTVAPSGPLTVYADAKLNDLLLAGTNITADGSLAVETGAAGVLTLGATGTGAINIGAGATDKAITIGNSSGSNAVDVVAGTAGFSVTTDAATADGISLQATSAGGGVDIDAATDGIASIDGGTTNVGTSSATDVNVGNATGATTLDLDSGTGGTTIDSTGTISIDGVGASNVTTDSGDLTLSATTSGDVNVTSAAGDVNITASTELDFMALGSDNISLNQSSDINFRSEVTNTGISSIIGAINGIIDGTIVGPGTDVSLQEAYVFGNTITTTSAEGSFTVSGTETLLLNAGSSTGAVTIGNDAAGAVLIAGGATSGVSVTTSNGSTSSGGAFTVTTGNGDGAVTGSNIGGLISLNAGTGGTVGTGGGIELIAGPGGSTSGDGGAANLTGGSATDGFGGDAVVTGGAATGANDGGFANLVGGAGGATGAGGTVNICSGAGGATSGNSGDIFFDNGTATVDGATSYGGITFGVLGQTDSFSFTTADSTATYSPNGFSVTTGVTDSPFSNSISLTTGDARTGSTSDAAEMTLTTGNGDGAGNGGAIGITTGNGGDTGVGGELTILSGDGGATSGNSGDIRFDNGTAVVDGVTSYGRMLFGSSNQTDSISFLTADSTATYAPSGPGINISTGVTDAGLTSNYINIEPGDARTGSAARGADLCLHSGSGDGVGIGGAITARVGDGGATGVGGEFRVTAGDGGSTSGTGGEVHLESGAATDGVGGLFHIVTGAGGGANAGGQFLVAVGDGGATGAGGDISMTSGLGGATSGAGGAVAITAGAAGSSAAAGGAASFLAGAGGATGIGGDVTMRGGAGGATSGNGGDVTISGGAAAGTGTDGAVSINPISDGDINIGNTSGGLVEIHSAAEINFRALGSNNIPLNESSDVDFISTIISTGVDSIVGAINGIVDGTISISGATTSLQDAYVNGNTITTSSAEGIITIAGDQAFTVSTTGSLNLGGSSTGTILVGNASAGALTIDSGAGVSIDGAAASNFSTSAGDLTLSATAASVNIVGTEAAADSVFINAAGVAGGGLDINVGTAGGTIDSTGALSFDAAVASNFTVTGSGQSLTLEAAGGGAQQVIINSAGTGLDAVDINSSAGGIDINAATTLDLDGVTVNLGDSIATDVNIGVNGATGTTINVGNSSAGAVTIDSGAASNFTTSAGDLTLEASAGSVNIVGTEAAADSVFINAAGDAGGGLDINVGTAGGTIDSTGILSLDAVGASNFTTDSGALTISTTTSGDVILSSVADITFGANGGATETYNQSGDLELNSIFSAASITSLIGALNAIQDGRVALSASVSSANDVKNTYTVAAGVSLESGDAVYISGADEISLCDANAAATSDCIGFAENAASAGDTVSVITDGIHDVDLIAGLTVGASATEVHAGAVVFLSGTSGKLTTDDSVFGTGDTVHAVGFIKDIISYDGSTGNEAVEVQIRFGEKTTLA